MKEEKLEQLRKVFKVTAKRIWDTGRHTLTRLEDQDMNEYFNKMANELVYEVKIRINNK